MRDFGASEPNSPKLASLLLLAVFGALSISAAPPAAGEVRVAAIQATGMAPDKVDPRCANDANCAVEILVRRAAAAGAALVVTPEYALAQTVAEPTPSVGVAPGSTESGPLLERFSALADELDVYLVIDLETTVEDDFYNSQVAFAPDGIVVAVHHKFELFGAERERLTRGESVSAFDTPFGRVGLLVCADIYGAPRFHQRLISELDARIIAWSAMWTAPGATRWQAAFARDWGVFLVGANGSAGGGRGSGVFTPDGEAIAVSELGMTTIVFADIPVAGQPAG